MNTEKCIICLSTYCFVNNFPLNWCKVNIAVDGVSLQNLSQMMCICLSETEAEARHHDEEVSRVAKTRHGAELLAAKEDGKKCSI